MSNLEENDETILFKAQQMIQQKKTERVQNANIEISDILKKYQLVLIPRVIFSANSKQPMFEVNLVPTEDQQK